MTDFLDTLVQDTKQTVASGYYAVERDLEHKSISLKTFILKARRVPVITEIKVASPTLGRIREAPDVGRMASELRKGGAIAISVLTEPKHFRGSLDTFTTVRRTVALPLLMKDILLSRVQIDAASAVGADVVLLIKALFDRRYCECDLSEMINYAHSNNLEVLLETSTEDEFLSTLDTEADLIGINNRDLKTLKVDINTTPRILQKIDSRDKVVVSESGIRTPQDIRALRQAGATAFLVGSAIMTAEDITEKTRELVMAL